MNTISFINLKGGVGKTTLTVAIGEFLAKEYDKKVLIVDLDPQTNATISLISQEKWSELNRNNLTLHQLFLDLVEDIKVFDVEKAIVKDVSNVSTERGNIDLLPSSVDLIDIVDKIVAFDQRKVVKVVRGALDKVKDNYDFILIDCPPDLGAITVSGLYSSNYYIIPVVADTLSTCGLRQVVDKISLKTRELKRVDVNYEISPLGIIINKFTNSASQNRIKTMLDIKVKNGELPKVFKNKVKRRDKIATLSEDIDLKISMKGKYPKEIFESIKDVVEEIIGEI